MKHRLFLVTSLILGILPSLSAQVTDSTTLARLPISKKGDAIASASSVNLAAATGDFVHITGTTAITALGTVMAGREITLVFDGALTFTHDSTSLILPTGANITTAAGDTARMISEGSGNWRCVSYTRKNGEAVQPRSTANSIGYTTGAGGTVTQSGGATSGVTINKPSGQITTNTETIAAGVEVSFTVTNSAVAATDTVNVTIASGVTGGTPVATVTAVAAGSFQITLTNLHGTNDATGTWVINFNVIKGASS